MKPLFALLFIFSFTLSFSQEMPCRKSYPSSKGGGCMERYTEDANGEKHGKYISYDVNGNVTSRGNYVHGVKQGNWYNIDSFFYPSSYFWYENGKYIIHSENPINSYQEALKLNEEYFKRQKEEKAENERRENEEKKAEQEAKIKAEQKRVLSALAEKAEIEKKQPVTIYNQIWMAQNLNVNHFANGEPIKQATSREDWEQARGNKQPAWTWSWSFNDNDSTLRPYSKLYNYWAVADARNLCPTGWQIPGIDDWEKLNKFLGVKDFKSAIRDEFSVIFPRSEINGSYYEGMSWWWSSYYDGHHGSYFYVTPKGGSGLMNTDPTWFYYVRCIKADKADEDAYKTATTINTYDGFSKYLSDFPNGRHADEAKKVIDKEKDDIKSGIHINEIVAKAQKNVLANSHDGFEEAIKQSERILRQAESLEHNSWYLPVSIINVLAKWGLNDIDGAKATYTKYKGMVINFNNENIKYTDYFESTYKEYKKKITLPDEKANYKKITRD